MKNKFLLGAIAGASALIVAVPLIAELTSAQGSGAGSMSSIPSQACVQALVAKDTAVLSTIDAETAARKTALQAHQAALQKAAGLTDDAARQAAVKKANDDLRTAMKNAKQSESDEKRAMDGVKAACGNRKHGMFGMGWNGHKRHGKRDGASSQTQTTSSAQQ